MKIFYRSLIPSLCFLLLFVSNAWAFPLSIVKNDKDTLRDNSRKGSVTSLLYCTDFRAPSFYMKSHVETGQEQNMIHQVLRSGYKLPQSFGFSISGLSPDGTHATRLGFLYMFPHQVYYTERHESVGDFKLGDFMGYGKTDWEDGGGMIEIDYMQIIIERIRFIPLMHPAGTINPRLFAGFGINASILDITAVNDALPKSAGDRYGALALYPLLGFELVFPKKISLSISYAYQAGLSFRHTIDARDTTGFIYDGGFNIFSGRLMTGINFYF